MIPPLPLPKSLAISLLLSISVNLSTLEISSRGGYNIDLLLLASLSLNMLSRFIPCRSIYQNVIPFMVLHNILFYVDTTFCLSFHLMMDTWVDFTSHVLHVQTCNPPVHTGPC